MRNFVQPGENITVTAPYAVESGELVVIGAMVGVANSDAENGAEVVISTQGVFDLAKVPAVVFTAGEVVYTTTAGGAVTDNTDADSNSGGTVKVGYAVQAAGAGAGTVRVRLVPVI